MDFMVYVDNNSNNVEDLIGEVKKKILPLLNKYCKD